MQFRRISLAGKQLLSFAVNLALINAQPMGGAFYGGAMMPPMSPYGGFGGSPYGGGFSGGPSPFMGMGSPGFGSPFGGFAGGPPLSPFDRMTGGPFQPFPAGGGAYGGMYPSMGGMPMFPGAGGQLGGYGNGPYGNMGAGYGQMGMLGGGGLGLMSTMQNKENFQASGCAWDALTNRCSDAFNLCKGGCQDFNNYGLMSTSSSSLLTAHDCRCIPMGFASMLGKKKKK